MKILFATDGLRPADRAGMLLAALADPSKADIMVLAVAGYEFATPERDFLLEESLESRRGYAATVVDAAAKVFASEGFATNEKVVDGYPAHEICRLASGADLVVLGAGRHSWLGNTLLGSTSTQVLHESPASVFVVHEFVPHDGPIKVLVGTDGSKASHLAAKLLAEASHPSRIEVEVMAAVPQPAAVMAYVPTNGGFAYPDVTAAEEESERRLRSRAEREMRRVAGIFTEAGFDVTDQLAMGPPSEQLLKEAESGTFDLVAVGSRGLGPVRRVLLGSVSDHVARLARAAFVARSVT